MYNSMTQLFVSASESVCVGQSAALEQIKIENTSQHWLGHPNVYLFLMIALNSNQQWSGQRAAKHQGIKIEHHLFHESRSLQDSQKMCPLSGIETLSLNVI